MTLFAFLSCGLIKVWKTRYTKFNGYLIESVVVWLKFGKHDIYLKAIKEAEKVVVWLKFGKHDILQSHLL